LTLVYLWKEPPSLA
jgi:hypothetical protein